MSLNFCVSFADSIIQGGVTKAIHYIDCSPIGKKPFQRPEVAIACREMRGGTAVIVTRI